MNIQLCHLLFFWILIYFGQEMMVKKMFFNHNDATAKIDALLQIFDHLNIHFLSRESHAGKWLLNYTQVTPKNGLAWHLHALIWALTEITITVLSWLM